MRTSPDLALPSCASESGPFHELVRLPRPCFRGHECSAPLCCSKLRQAEFVARGGFPWHGAKRHPRKNKNPGGKGPREDGESPDGARPRLPWGGVWVAAARHWRVPIFRPFTP